MKKLLSFVVCMCIILGMTAFASESSLDDGLIFSADFDRTNGCCQAVQLQTDGGVLSRGLGTIKSNGLSGDSLTGKAYREDGTPQGLAFANGGISKLISGQSAATVSVWVKFDAVHDSAKRENIMLVHINGTTVGCELYTQSGWLYASSRSQNGKGMKSAKYMPEAWEKDAWYHIIASFDYENKAITLYVNGEKAAENTNAAFETNVFTTGTVTAYDSIGLNHKATGTTDMNRLNGSVDDFRLYNRALTADEVSALYNKQYGEALENGLLADIDFEQRNSDGEYLYRVLENGVMTVKSTGAVRLAETEGALGTGKAARMMWYGYECGENVIGKALDGAENAAFSVWVKLNSIPTGSERQQLFLVTVNGASAGLEAYAISNGFVFAGRSQAADKWQSVSTAEMTLNPGQWYHVAGNVSFKDKQFEIYVDGVKAEKASVAFGADTYTNVAHTKNDYLGVNAITRTPSGVYKLDGIMENFRVYNRRLTEEEIEALGKPVMLYMTKEDNSVIAEDSASADDKITFFAQAPELGGAAKLIVAVYDSNGSLTRAEIKDIAEEGVFADAGALSPGDTVKGFILSGADSIRPLAPPRVLNIAEEGHALLHWSFNEQNGGFIKDSIGDNDAVASGYERENGCMNFSDGKIYYLSQYIADELKDQNAFSVYARFTAKKDAEFDIFTISDEYKMYVKDGQLRIYLNSDGTENDILLGNIISDIETETLICVSPARIRYSLYGSTRTLNIGKNLSPPSFSQCEGSRMYLKNVSINDIAVFAGEKTLAGANAETDKNVVVDTDPDLAGEWHFEPADGGVLADYSGKGYNGNGINTKTGSGVTGKAVKYTSYLGSRTDISNEINKEFSGKSSYSVSMWVQCSMIPTCKQVLWNNYIDNAASGLNFSVNKRYISVGGRNCPEDSWQARTFDFDSYGRWRHLLAVMDYENKRIRLFVDGEEQTARESGQPDWKSPVYINGSTALQSGIGGDIAESYCFNGYIDDAFVFAGTPSADRIKLLSGIHADVKSDYDCEKEELEKIKALSAENAVFCIGGEDVIYNGKRLKLCPENLNAKTVLHNGNVMVPAKFLKNFPGAAIETVLINGVEYADLKQAASAFGMKCEMLDNGIVMLCSGEPQLESALISRLSSLFNEKKYPAPKEDYASTRNVVAYSDPADNVFIRTPDLYRIGENSFFAMHDKTRSGTHLLKSSDGGESWNEIYVFKGLYFASLFEDGGAYYVIGLRGGKINVHKSTDGGYTWTVPADSKSGALFDNMSGYAVDGGMSIVKHNGRIYKAYEDRVGPSGGTSWVRDYQAFVVSAPEGSDLLDEANWTVSNKLVYPSAVKPSDIPMVNEKGWLEGNMAVDPDGNVLNLLRFNSDPQAQPGWICVVKVSPDGKTISFDEKDGFAELNGANSRFSVKYDDKTGYYYSLVNSNTDPDFFLQRNVLRLAVSKDLKTWDVLETILADETLIPWQDSLWLHSFSYVDFEFDGADIVFLVRESADNAYSYHDNNYITFYRISGYEKILERNGINP